MGQSAVLRALSEAQTRAQIAERTANNLKATVAQQQRAITALGRGLVMVAQMAGLEAHLAKVVRADINNPAQPIPDGSEQGPVQTTEDALAGDSANPVKRDAPAGGNSGDILFAPGEVPGSTAGVPADTTADVTAPGGVIDTPAYNELQDVTSPVSGTTGPLPLDQVKIEHDVVAEPGDTTTTMFPMTGPFTEQMSTSGSAEQQRFVASLRLARLRVAAGITAGEDVAIAQSIHDSDLSYDAIARETMTLESVRQAQARQQSPTTSARLVPRTAAPTRSAPSLSPEGAVTVPLPPIVGSVGDDEVAFE